MSTALSFVATHGYMPSWREFSPVSPVQTDLNNIQLVATAGPDGHLWAHTPSGASMPDAADYASGTARFFKGDFRLTR